MKQTYETGLQGEAQAEAYLRDTRGMVCLGRRYRTSAGEIDLIMRDGETIVFVEVKTRRTAAPGEGLRSVDTRKQGRIARAAQIYLMTEHQTNRPVRFDAIEISHGNVLYIPNAFQPGGMFYR